MYHTVSLIPGLLKNDRCLGTRLLHCTHVHCIIWLPPPAGKERGKAPLVRSSHAKKVTKSAKATEWSNSGSESEKPSKRPRVKKSAVKKVCVCVCINLRVYVCMYVLCMYVCVHYVLCRYVCVHVCAVYACVCVCVY